MNSTKKKLIGLLVICVLIVSVAIPFYYLSWYVIGGIHIFSFALVFLLGKFVQTRKFQNLEGIYAGTILLGIGGLIIAFLNWEKTSNSSEAIDDKLDEPYTNKYLNEKVLTPLLKIWNNNNEEDYTRKAFELWKKFLIEEVIEKDKINHDFDPEYFDSLLTSNKNIRVILDTQGAEFLDSNDNLLFSGEMLDIRWGWVEFDENNDEVDMGDEYSNSFRYVAASQDGFVANLPIYHYCMPTNGHSVWEGNSIDELCETLSSMKITDFNALSERDRRDITHIDFSS